MKFYLALVILTGFIAVAVFGFAAMNNDHEGCIAALAKGTTTCPLQSPLDQNTALHLGIFKSFSVAILTLTNLATLFGIAVFVILGYALYHKSYTPTNLSLQTLHIRLQETLRKAKAPILRICALHEKRDPAVFSGAFG